MSAGEVAPDDMPPARRWYRRLLRLLAPRALRAAHGTEMEDLFLDALQGREHAGPRGHGARLVCRDVGSVARVSCATLQTPASQSAGYPRKA